MEMFRAAPQHSQRTCLRRRCLAVLGSAADVHLQCARRLKHGTASAEVCEQISGGLRGSWTQAEQR